MHMPFVSDRCSHHHLSSDFAAVPAVIWIRKRTRHEGSITDCL